MFTVFKPHTWLLFCMWLVALDLTITSGRPMVLLTWFAVSGVLGWCLGADFAVWKNKRKK